MKFEAQIGQKGINIMKKAITKLLTVAIIMLLAGVYIAGCGKTTKASEPEVAETAEAAEEAAKEAETAEASEEQAETDEEAAEEAEDQEVSEEQAETDKEAAEASEEQAETDEEAAEEAEDQEVSEEERLAAFVSSLEKLDPVKDRYALNSELVRVKNDEVNVEFQRAVIHRLLSAKTEQVSPCQEGQYPIVRVFKGFTLVDGDGRVEAYQDGRHLHLGEGWKVLNGHGVETVEENAVVWKLGDFPFWVLAQKGEDVYIFHWLEKADAENDPVFSGYNADIRQQVKAIVAQCEEEETVSEKNRNLLESVAFQLSLKPVDSKDYCIVQYLTRTECRGTDWTRRTLVNLKVDDEGIPQSINSEEMSLIICKEDLSLKVTMVTDEPVTLETDDE